MSLRLYNTLTREKAPFVPATPGEVRMYVCGVTPYDVAHIGHGRSALAFDVLRRYLAFLGYRVRFVRNVTDVEDKIIARAARSGEPWDALVERYLTAYADDMAWLGVVPPTEAPRATRHIEPEPGRPYRMGTLIARLVEKGSAYVVDGDVYFEVRRFPAYGRFSGRALDELRAGARVEVDERKRDPLDFALWKAAKPGEPSWPSPWGPGRPGWHIECSAMSMEYLGESFDIHGGGQDLVFPHHENEIAQSEAATGVPFARYWVHNGLVQVGAEKMSKSLGNMLNMVDLRPYPREAVRFHLLGSHYRGPLDFRADRIPEAERALGRMHQVIGGAFERAGETGVRATGLDWTEITHAVVDDLVATLGPDGLGADVRASAARFRAAMDDDLNTPDALGALFDLSHALNRHQGAGLAGQRLAQFRDGAAVLLALGRVLGLFWGDVNPYELSPDHRAEFEPWLVEREDARRRRDFRRADEIRESLEVRGVTIEDTPGGPRLKWKRAPDRR